MRSLDGFFATRAAAPKATLYCISKDASASRLVCLASDDHGTSWRDYAVSDPVQNPYSIGGCRELSTDGFILGSFTDQAIPTTEASGSSQVFFFRIKTEHGSAPAKPSIN